MNKLKNLILSFERRKLHSLVKGAMRFLDADGLGNDLGKKFLSLLSEIEITPVAPSDLVIVDYDSFKYTESAKTWERRIELYSTHQIKKDFRTINDWDTLLSLADNGNYLLEELFDALSEVEVIQLCLNNRFPKPIQTSYNDLALWLGAAVPNYPQIMVENTVALFLANYLIKSEAKEIDICKLQNEVLSKNTIKWEYLYAEVSAYRELQQIRNYI